MADGVEVAVDFTALAAARANARWCADHGVHAVIGTTGFTPDDIDDMNAAFSTSNCLVAPNFAIGAVLMMRFAELAAPHEVDVESRQLGRDSQVHQALMEGSAKIFAAWTKGDHSLQCFD
jgi:4-hydroxy-tetrahydrodipicolinate reductase